MDLLAAIRNLIQNQKTELAGLILAGFLSACRSTDEVKQLLKDVEVFLSSGDVSEEECVFILSSLTVAASLVTAGREHIEEFLRGCIQGLDEKGVSLLLTSTASLAISLDPEISGIHAEEILDILGGLLGEKIPEIPEESFIQFIRSLVTTSILDWKLPQLFLRSLERVANFVSFRFASPEELFEAYLRFWSKTTAFYRELEFLLHLGLSPDEVVPEWSCHLLRGPDVSRLSDALGFCESLGYSMRDVAALITDGVRRLSELVRTTDEPAFFWEVRLDECRKCSFALEVVGAVAGVEFFQALAELAENTILAAKKGVLITSTPGSELATTMILASLILPVMRRTPELLKPLLPDRNMWIEGLPEEEKEKLGG